jgi:hypothetical protein
LLDASDHVRGTLVATGGPQPATFWLPLAEPTLRWPAVLERLLRAPETPPSPRDVALRHGPVHIVPIRGGGAAYVQSTYAWRTDGAPTVARVAVHGAGPSRDSVALGTTLSDALGVHPDSGATRTPVTPTDFRARVGELYSAMRDAMRRGDWPAFGKAYDELGKLLRLPAPK